MQSNYSKNELVNQILASLPPPVIPLPDVHICPVRHLRIKLSHLKQLENRDDRQELYTCRLKLIKDDVSIEQYEKFEELIKDTHNPDPVAEHANSVNMRGNDSPGEIEPVGDDVNYPALQIRTLEEIKPRTIEWLVPGWIPKRGITLIAGQPGAGKTTLALSLAAAATRGGYWGDQDVEKGEVILYCAEDTFPEIIVPNLMAQKAKLNMIHNPVAGVDDDGIPEPFNPGKHIELLREELKKRRNVKLMVIDPALSIASKAKDEYRANDIRKALEPVQALAEDAGIAIVCITHFLKRHNATGSNILDRVIGSQAWGAVARMVLAVEQQNAGRACMRVKSNWGLNHGGFSFDISSEKVQKGIEGKYIQFGAGIDGAADTVIGVIADKEAPKTNEAIDWLIQYLEQNPNGVDWNDAIAAAKDDADITKTTLKNARYALKNNGKISMERLAAKGGKTVWKLNE